MDQKSLTMSGFLSSLESSGWLKHVRSVLDTSELVFPLFLNEDSEIKVNILILAL